MNITKPSDFSLISPKGEHSNTDVGTVEEVLGETFYFSETKQFIRILYYI